MRVLLNDTTSECRTTFAQMLHISCFLCFFPFFILWSLHTMSPALSTTFSKHAALVPSPLRLEANKQPKANVTTHSTPRSVPVPTFPEPEAAQRPKANAPFRAVEGQLHRLLIHVTLRDKVVAAEANDIALLNLPAMRFFCIQCRELECIPCRNRISCRTRCILCCNCPMRRN